MGGRRPKKKRLATNVDGSGILGQFSQISKISSNVGAHGVIPQGLVVVQGDTGEVRFQGCEEILHGYLYTLQV